MAPAPAPVSLARLSAATTGRQWRLGSGVCYEKVRHQIGIDTRIPCTTYFCAIGLDHACQGSVFGGYRC